VDAAVLRYLRPPPMLPIDIPPGTTVETLVTEVMPALHARMVAADTPPEALTVALHVDGCGDYTLHIRGAQMRVETAPTARPTLWVHTTERALEHFLDDAAGPKRFLPKFPPVGGVRIATDPRVIKRAALANGRIELALCDADGERLALVMGFGDAARKPIDPDDPDVVLEISMGTLERILCGQLGPEEALADGHVKLRGNRLLALQLALAVAPFYPAKR
jgi:putative sterol carrier protein